MEKINIKTWSQRDRKIQSTFQVLEHLNMNRLREGIYTSIIADDTNVDRSDLARCQVTASETFSDYISYNVTDLWDRLQNEVILCRRFSRHLNIE